MTRYDVIQVSLDDGGFDLDGRVVAVDDNSTGLQGAITLLVERADDGEDIPSTFEEVADDTPTCAGKGGECSRTVEQPGDRCWQHPEDE